MGLLLFAFRKLDLKRRINRANYRLMQISNQRQRVQDQMDQLQQCLSNSKNMFEYANSNAMMADNQAFFTNCNENSGMNTDFMYQMQNRQLQYAQKAQMFNSVFEARKESLLKPLSMMDEQFDTEQANLETRLKSMQAELQNVEKAEDNEAKNSAPKFGQ
jgi:hypothetical protein